MVHELQLPKPLPVGAPEWFCWWLAHFFGWRMAANTDGQWSFIVGSRTPALAVVNGLGPLKPRPLQMYAS